MGVNWKELFPTKLTIVIFILYMSLFVAQGLLVKASQNQNNQYSYDTTTVVLLTETLKLIASAVIFCTGNSIKLLVTNIFKGSKLLILYFVPAFLYCLYNNLAFLNLSSFDPTTYFLLLQLRVVFTGVLFQIIFKRKLSKLQWFSLIILTFGCMIKQLNFSMSTPDTNTEQMSKMKIVGLFSMSLILLQTICSSLAGVYNEFLLKKSADTDIYIQNVFMYLDSIVCNVVLILLQGNISNVISVTSMQQIIRFDVILIIINNCAVGIVTSFFLKYLNSILKTFASALELVFTAILSYILFAVPIYLNTTLAIFLVSIAIYLYSQSPVVNIPKNSQKSNTKESEKLLSDLPIEDV